MHPGERVIALQTARAARTIGVAPRSADDIKRDSAEQRAADIDAGLLTAEGAPIPEAIAAWRKRHGWDDGVIHEAEILPPEGDGYG